jgi:uncharacterized coiled-coil DUF342 family protein
LQEKLIEMAKLSGQAVEVKKEIKQERQKKQHDRESFIEGELKKKEEMVEEKLRTKKKLTTEDLIILQGTMKDKD